MLLTVEAKALGNRNEDTSRPSASATIDVTSDTAAGIYLVRS